MGGRGCLAEAGDVVMAGGKEEASFSRTLIKGVERFKKAGGCRCVLCCVSADCLPSRHFCPPSHAQVAAAAQGGVLNGDDVFQLWDTFGFPVDLTELMAQEQGLKVDKEGEWWQALRVVVVHGTAKASAFSCASARSRHTGSRAWVLTG